MSTDNIPKDVKLGIRLANTDSDAITHGGPDLTDASLMGDIRVKTGVKYEEITGVTAVNRGSDENINEMYTDISDNFERPIYIKKDGSGSFEIISRLATSGADSFNLEFCAKEYPMGVTTTTEAAASYNPLDDDGDNTGFGDGYAGYNIYVEQPVVVDGTPSVKYTEYHNCYLKCTTAYGVGKATRTTIEWSIPRTIVEVKNVAAASSLFE